MRHSPVCSGGRRRRPSLENASLFSTSVSGHCLPSPVRARAIHPFILLAHGQTTETGLISRGRFEGYARASRAGLHGLRRVRDAVRIVRCRDRRFCTVKCTRARDPYDAWLAARSHDVAAAWADTSPTVQWYRSSSRNCGRLWGVRGGWSTCTYSLAC